DVVWAIRTLKPDVIINRFNHRTSGETHGQHTASALLGIEAFDLAGDAKAYPGQLEYTTVFQPKRLFFNTSPWFYSSQQEFEQDSKGGNFVKFDTGVYFPFKGLSNPEIAALSRSEHQSQGFGSTGSRGEQIEHLELLKGDQIGNKKDIFHGIDTSWNRVKGGKRIGDIIAEIEKEYNFRQPSASIPKLLTAYEQMLSLEDSHWKSIKIEEIKAIIASAAGLYLEATATSPTSTPGEKIELDLEAINRSDFGVNLVSVDLKPNTTRLNPEKDLVENTSWKQKASFKINENVELTSPYWLTQKGSIGLYHVEDQELTGLPEAPKKVLATFTLKFGDVSIPFDREVVYKYNDPVKGEVYQPFEIIPPVSARFPEKVIIFSNNSPATVPVTITAGMDNVSGNVTLNASEKWKIEPVSNSFEISQKGESVTLQFRVFPPE